jgi:RNA polymerase sigma-70 factor (ECF subfamily)
MSIVAVFVSAAKGWSMANEPMNAASLAAMFEPAQLEQFSRRLIGLARAHLNGKLLHKVDPEDVVQSAYKSLLLRYQGEDLAHQGLDSLWSLLTVITLRKCIDRMRYHRADCRDVSREASPQPDSHLEPWREALAREPAPEGAAVLAETVEQVLRDVSAAERPVIEMSLQGYTAQEVSQQLGRAERSVRRVRERLKRQLERQSLDALA